MSKRRIFAAIARMALCCFLAVISPRPANAAALMVALPDDGVFCVWVGAGDGRVVVPPFTSRGHGTISLPIRPLSGQTLFVLDEKTGRVAASPIQVDSAAAASPIALLVSDFQPVSAAGNSAPAPEPRLAASLAHDGMASAPAGGDMVSAPDGNPSSVSSGDDDAWVVPAGMFLLGAALTGFCGWAFAKSMRRARPAYESLPPPSRAFASEPPVSRDRSPAFGRPGRPRYRVTKSGGRGSRRRIRAHVPHLVGTDGLAAGAKFVLSTPIVSIGRDGDNDIVLAESKVSRRHARIEHGPSGGFLLIDEASANGVYINGMRMEKAVLRQGDEIKIGDSFFRYEE